MRPIREVREIPGFPGYSITEGGSIWSGPRQNARGRTLRGRWLRPALQIRGYLKVSLCRDSCAYDRYIHRLILETYVGSCPDGMEACHNNGDKLDNRLENLRWDTRSSNNLDTVRHGNCPLLASNFPHAQGENHSRAKLTEQQVRQIIYTYGTGLFTQKKIGEQYGVSDATINGITLKKTWKHLWQ